MLKIRSIWKAAELKRFKELERKHHYMGETHSGGDTLRLVIEDDGEWVAIMVWGGACYHLKRCNENVTSALLMARSTVFVFFARSGLDNCQQFKEELQSNPRHVFQMVTKPTSN